MEPGSEFNFHILSNHKFPSLEKAEVKENLAKWSMTDGLKIQAFSFDKPFKKYNERDFLVSFLGCQNVASTLLKATPEHVFSPIGVPADIIKFSEVKCTLTTLEIFEKLKQGQKVVRQNGNIVKCMPHYIRAGAGGDADRGTEGYEIEIADNLRKIILSNEDEEEDFYEISDCLAECDKKEFLFSLFSHFVIGGSLCQYEDNVEPYTMTTKLFYKDLIGVAASPEDEKGGSKNNLPSVRGAGDGDSDKDNDGRKLKIISHVYKIHSATTEGGGGPLKRDLLFNRNHLNNFFYVIVNPLKQTCITLYHHV